MISRTLITRILCATAACALLAGVYFSSRPGRPLQTLGVGCAGCHVRSLLAIDGPAAAALSKGVHPIAAEQIATPRDAAQCLSCHQNTHATWSRSAHGRAFTNPIFQHAFARDRKAWCLNCHAPLWNPETDGDAPEIAARPNLQKVYSEGVNCIACHVRDGEILGVTDYSKSNAQLFHPVRYDPGLARETFCAGCHQFNFVHELEPFAQYAGDEHPMQNVVAESAGTNGALYPRGCIDCHYADGDHSLKSEGKWALRDKIRINLQTSAAREPSGPDEPHASPGTEKFSVQLRIDVPRLAHHFPTGDLFRILSYYIHDARGREVYRYDFRKEVRVIDQAVISDTTLKPRPDQPGAGRVVTAIVPIKPARCRVVYRLQGAIDPDIAHDFEDPNVLYETVYDGGCDFSNTTSQ